MKPEYLSIGKVAKLKNISIKALRYYDEIGVFVPAYINPETNYRYYTKEQLPLLDAISLCLQLGIPLKTLPAYVKEDTFDFSALLADTRKLAEEKIHGIRLALDKIESSCKEPSSTAASASVSNKEPAHAVTPAQRATASIRFTFTQDEYLLALALEKDQLPPYDGFILKLFIFARQQNLSLENPSCILYRYESSAWKKYLCLKLTPNSDTTPQFVAQTLENTEFSLFQICAGEYTKRLRQKSLEYPSSNSISTFGKFTEELASSLLERRLTDTVESEQFHFELLELFTVKCN